MRALIILIIIGITACNASKQPGSGQSQISAEDYKANPDESVLELTIEEVSENDKGYLVKARVIRIVTVGFSFESVYENQQVDILSKSELNKGDIVYGVIRYKDSPSGPQYSLKSILKK